MYSRLRSEVLFRWGVKEGNDGRDERGNRTRYSSGKNDCGEMPVNTNEGEEGNDCCRLVRLLDDFWRAKEKGAQKIRTNGHWLSDWLTDLARS